MAIILNGTTHSLRSNDFGASRPSAYSIATWWRGDATPPSSDSYILAVSQIEGASDAGNLFLSWGHASASFRNRAGVHQVSASYVPTDTAGAGAATTWVHKVATYSAGSLRFYEDGAQIGTIASATVSAAAPPSWAVGVGAFRPGGTSVRAAGRVCMIAYWDAEITTDEVAALGKGFAPRHIRPASLRYFVPGLRSANAIVGTTHTASNLTYTDDNPRIIW